MKKMPHRPAPFLLIALMLAACDYTVDPRQVSTIDINVRLGSTTAYPGSSFFLGTVTQLTSRDYVFTVENIGYRGDLNLTGSPAVGLTDPDFTVTVQPAAVTLAPGASTTFTLRYTPPDAGTHTAVISIPNNDVGETDFQIGLIGSGGALVAAPSVTGTTPAHTTMPTWTWTSGGGGIGIYRYKLDSNDFTSGATETTNLSYTPGASISDGSHTLYVQERNYAGTEWSSSGSFTISVESVVAIGWIGGGSNGWKTSSTRSSGNDYQSFGYSSVHDVFVAGSGTIFTADSENHRICTWDQDGNAIGWIGGGSDGWKTTSGTTYSSSYQSFNSPCGVFIDASGNIYVADHDNQRVSKWNSAGVAQGWIGGGSDGWKTTAGASSGNGYQSFAYPFDVFVDADGNIYVSDSINYRISKWNSSGVAQGWIGGGSDGWKTSAGAGYGSGYQSFGMVRGIFLDTSGTLYAADEGNDRISKWNSSGVALGWIGGGSDGWQTTSTTPSGNGFRYFDWPESVFVDTDGNIFVAEYSNHRVSQWNVTGNAIGWFGGGYSGWRTTNGATWGNGYNYFNSSFGIYMDNAGNFFICDSSNYCVSKWHQY